ncbi:hypothetical protein EGT07_09830 [Herbaspirillum sp. HC18]|nr:hypothetical protein EGT07_09830 [Herbaspirillum sp. HC18]
MEKSHSRSSSTKAALPAVGGKPYNVDLVVRRNSNVSAKRDPVPGKLSREDISRCINIWARMYLTPEERMNTRELCLPSRPWLGRNPSSVKRFE